MNGDAFTLSADQATAMLRGLVPGVQVAGVERFAGGETSGACEVRLTGTEDTLIVKVYAPDGADRMIKERHVYGLLAEHGVTATPRILGGADHLGRPFLVMTRVAGQSLKAVKALLTPDDLAEVYRQLGELLAEVHRIELDGFGYLHREGIHDPQPTNSAFMTRLAAEKLAAFEARGGDPALQSAASAYIADRAPLLARCPTPRLLHNDFHEGNVLVDRTAAGPVVTGFIDVENAMAGDPLADIAKTYAYDIADQPDEDAKLRGFEAGYGGFPADWRRGVALYRVIHAFELWVFFHDIGEHRFLGSLSDQLRGLIAEG